MSASQIAQMRSRGLVSQRCPGINTLMPNQTRCFDGFHISYARHLPEYGCPTTALVLGGRVFFVLNGNHAADMVDAAMRDGLQGCIDLFLERIHLANDLSEHPAAAGVAVDPFELHPTTLALLGHATVDRIVAAMSQVAPRP